MIAGELGSRLRAVGVAGGLILLVLPASVFASTRKATTILPGGFGNTARSAKAVCPDGERATGGGFRTVPSNFAAMGHQVSVSESRKIGQRAWKVTARDTGAPSPLTAYVYCSKDAPVTKANSSTPSGGPASAFCGRGTSVQAGGFVSGPLGETMDDSLRTSGNRWVASGAEDHQDLRAYAYCSGDAAKPVARSAVRNGPALFRSTYAVRSPKCKPGTNPVAGGFAQTGGSFSPAVWLYESVRDGNRWRTAGTVSASILNSLTSIAYCA